MRLKKTKNSPGHPTNNILFIDTESDEDFKCYAIQTYFQKKVRLFHPLKPEDYSEIETMWKSADAIVFFNAPYDMGVLSHAFVENQEKWVVKKIFGKESKAASFHLTLFGCKYEVRKINHKFNLIKNRNYAPKKKSPPVIDLLKLWSIFIDDGRTGNKIGLKPLIEREFEESIISWENRNTDLTKYLTQDVIFLPELFIRFLQKVSPIEEVRGFTLQDWADIKTNATITKYIYKNHYQMTGFDKMNYEKGKSNAGGFNGILETAYFGGLTLALYRGWIKNKTVWYDIKSSYADIFTNMNLDRYLLYDMDEIPVDETLINRSDPYLCQCRTTAVFKRMDDGLKLFELEQPVANVYIWSFDILSLSLIFPEAKISVLKMWKPIPLLDTDNSLPQKWTKLKDKQEKDSTKYWFYKLLANTAYGITAQRKPLTTTHTNLVIAGIITARGRLTLCEMMDEARKQGFKWVYSDTDSICMSYKKYKDITDILNKRIYPYKCDCEGYNYKTLILSLKRYLSYDGTQKNKIKLHGKGLTDIRQEQLYDFIVLNQNLPKGNVKIYQLGANTERSREIMRNKLALDNIPPFSFVKNIDTNLSYKRWFKDWYFHIDKKLTYPKNISVINGKEKESKREFLKFKNMDSANLYLYNSKNKSKDTDTDDALLEIYSLDDILNYYFS